MNGLQIGRIVHYVSYGTPNGEFKSLHRAAIITEIHDAETGVVSLCILNPTGMFFSPLIRHDESGKQGTWHWVEPK